MIRILSLQPFQKPSLSCMYRVVTILLAQSLLFSYGFWVPLEAAKKYYPPGFKLPTGLGDTLPGTAPTLPSEPEEEPSGSHPQIIIKTIPLQPPAKPKDTITQLLSERRFYEALRLTDQKLKKSPNNFPLRILRGQILREDENFQQSAAEYQTVLEKTKLKPLQAKAWSGLGMVQFYQGQHAESLGDHYGAQALTVKAEASFQKALQLSPQLGEAWLGRAQVAMAQNQFTQSEMFLQKAHPYGVPKILELLTKSQLLFLEGKPGQALPIAFSAKKEAPNDPRVYLLLGQISIALDRIDDAIINLKQTLERIPDHPEALRLLSLAYERKMKPEDAQLILQKAISLNPKDLESVRALLKLYDQRDEAESGILLLKTLLSKPLGSEESQDHQPLQLSYQQELMERLCLANRWQEAFDEGSDFILGFATRESHDPKTLAGRQTLLSLFCKAAYLSGQGLLNPQPFLTLPAVHQALAMVEENLQNTPSDLQQRLNMLLLNPMATLPPNAIKPINSPDNLLLSLQISFLAGNQALRQTLLTQLMKETELPTHTKLQTIKTLYQLGDYTTGETLLQQWELPPSDIKTLTQQVSEAHKRSEEQLKVLMMLPRNIPLRSWEEMAQSALLTTRSSWKLHAVLADAFYQQKRYEQAMVHQRLAAQYAPSTKERERWLKKASKTRVLGTPSPNKTTAASQR